MKSVEEKNVSGTIVYVNLGEPRLETLYEHLSKQEMEDFWRADLDLASSVQDGWTSTEAAGQLEEHAIAEFKRLHDLVRLRQERRRREARRNRERSTPQPTPHCFKQRLCVFLHCAARPPSREHWGRGHCRTRARQREHALVFPMLPEQRHAATNANPWPRHCLVH